MSEAALRRTALQWLREGRRAVEVRVSQAQGSVPRPAGTRMLVAHDEVAGSIGGGHLELQAIDAARDLLVAARTTAAVMTAPPPAPAGFERRVPLGPALGQCCGGVVTLAFAPFDEDTLARWPAPAPRFTLQLYGAGHVGRAIVRLLEGLDCAVQWIDERESEFPAGADAPHIERLCVEPVEAEVATAAPGAFYLVLTHSHDLDLRITEAILKRGDFAYLGLIGSATKRARFLHRFEQRGIAADAVARLTCPIGVAGIAGKEPEVIAVAVVAQLMQVSGAVHNEP